MMTITEGTGITAMASRAPENCQSGNRLGHKYGFCSQPFTLGLLLFHAIPVAAGVWDIVPRVSVAEIYTDNIDLEPRNEQSALITEVTPGISIIGRGGRFEAALDYQMQNFISSEFSDYTSTSHQLDADSTTELVDNFFFFDAGSRMGQSVINTDDTISLSNYNDNRNRTNVFSYTLSPYITPHFSNYADGTLRYSHSEVKYGKDSSSNSINRNGASDSTIKRINARLVNGSFFRQASWFGNYSRRDVSRDSSTDDTFEEADGEARYRISRTFSLVAQGGWTNDDIETGRDIDNGTYWAVGGFWQPNRFYSMQALTGNNLTTATLGLYPTVRTALRINYRDRDVGLNPGKVWSGSLSHRTRRTNWRAGYLEDTTTTQEQQLQASQGFRAVDPITGEVNPNPQPGDVVVNVPLPPIVTLTDEVLERKRAFGSVGVDTGKTGIRVNIFHEKRDFQESREEDTTRGISGSWNWRFAPRTNWILTGSWQRIERDNSINSSAADRDFWYIQPQLRRQIRRYLDGSVAYRFVRQDSDDDRNDYDENSVIARLTAYF
jgi:uncharacterized protein (PEP-CTERM system associated)